jgi:hypothetical protein
MRLPRSIRRTGLRCCRSSNRSWFPPDGTASNLDPGDRAAAGYPQVRHGSIKLTTLFNSPFIVE